MGCNYYLKYKKNMSIDMHNEYVDYSEVVIHLDNGYVYKNHYYKELPSDFYHLLHIGKSSCGWHFTLCIYPSLDIKSLEDWVQLFDDFEIEDEYGMVVSKEDMIDTITNRHIDRELTDEEVSKFCQNNHCEPGLNNLYAHKSTSYFKYQRTDGTYDLTDDWDFC